MASSDTIYAKLAKIRSNPKKAIKVAIALIKGFIVKSKYRLINPNIKIGAGFRVYAWPKICGPGKVIIGNNACSDLSFLRKPCILTHTKDSIIIIGDDCYLGGLRISCVDSVIVGNEVLFGSSTIIDSDIVPTANMTIDAKWKERGARPIKIGNSFWSGANAHILGGSVIRDECVLGSGAVLLNMEADERSLLVGNPARKIGVTREL